MLSAREVAKSVRFHARRAGIAALAAPREMPWLRRRLNLPSNRIFDPLSDGESSGVRILPLERGEIFHRPLPEFDQRSRAAAPFFSARQTEVAAPAYVLELAGGIAWGHSTGGVFTADRRFVPACTHDPYGPAFHAVWTRLRLPSPRRLRGRALYLVTPQATDNFHHWLVDLLPRLGQVQRAGYDLASFDHVIVNHSDRRYQLSTLEQLGLAPEKIIAAHDDLFLQVEELVVPSLKPSNQTLPAADLGFLRTAFLRGTSTAPQRRLFLSRADAGFRRLQGEEELHPFLHANGFEIVSLAGLAVAEQARLFAEAAVIAGPAGAAFANLVFATPPARVIEIAPPQWIAAFHWMISARLGLRHHLLLGAGPVMRGVPHASARREDIVLVPGSLEQLIGSVPA